LPLLPIRNAVLFPGTRATYHVGRKSSIALLETLAPGDTLGVFTQRDARQAEVDAPDLHEVGAVARVAEIEPADGGQYTISVEGTRRARLDQIVSHKPHLEGKVTILEDASADEPEALDLAARLVADLGPHASGLREAAGVHRTTPGRFADLVAAKLDLPIEDKIDVLSEPDVVARLRVLAERFAEYAKEDDGPSSKKERVLHTRVPAVLERELKRLAESLRVPVSNLVRAVLEDAVSVADAAGEGVEARLRRFAQNLEEERDRLKRRVQRDPLADVFAFQAVKLAMPATCAKCTKELKRGDTANLGMTEKPRTGGERVFVCDACLPTD
jgi:ATP-dependent Lon protease